MTELHNCPPAPFASSEVERPGGCTRHLGVSTSLDTNGYKSNVS
jgi:hypothetical protein